MSLSTIFGITCMYHQRDLHIGSYRRIVISYELQEYAY